MGDWYVLAHIPALIEKNAFNAIENYKYNEDEYVDGTEASFWIETAKKEYFFTTDRKIKYEPETV